MPSKLKNLVITKVALVDEGACSAAHIKLFKRKSEGGQDVMNYEDVMKSLSEEERSVVQAEIAKAKAELPEGAMSDEDKKVLEAKLAATEGDLAKAKETATVVETELNKMKASQTQQTEEELIKNADPAIRALFEKAKAQATAAEQIAKAALETQETTEALAKAKELPSISTDVDSLAGIFKAVKAKAPEVLDTLVGVLKAANEAVEKSVLTQVGSDNDHVAGDADKHWAEIEKAAAEIAKSGTVSKEAAISKAITANPDLYTNYLKSLE